MSKEILSLTDDLLIEYRDWLAEIENALRYLLKWVIRLSAQKEGTSDQNNLNSLSKIGTATSNLLENIPIYAKELKPVVPTNFLVEMIFAIRSPIIHIHMHLSLMKERLSGELAKDEETTWEMIFRYEELLFLLSQGAEPYFQALEQSFGDDSLG